MITGCSISKRVDRLDERFTALEEESVMVGAEGVGAATRAYGRDCVDGSCTAGKDLDDLTGMSDGDIALVPKDPTYGSLVYVYDDPSSTGDDPPWVIDPDSGTGEWILFDTTFGSIFGKMEVSNETSATVTVNDYDTGTYFANQDNDVIEFDLPSDPTDLVYCFGNSHVTGTPVAQAITVDPNASDYIVLDGSVIYSAGEDITSSGDGKDNICLAGLDSSYWKVTGYQGDWTGYDDITFWWQAETTAVEYCAKSGGCTMVLRSGAAINSDAVKLGTNGLDSPADYDRADIAIASDDIVAVDSGRIGFWFYAVTWPNPAADTSLFQVYLDADNFFWLEMTGNDGSGDLRLLWEDNNTARSSCSTSHGSMGISTWYFIEVSWETTTGVVNVWIDNVNECTNTDGNKNDFAAIRLDIGENKGTNTDFYIDQVVISNDTSRDLYDLVVTQSTTDYPG